MDQAADALGISTDAVRKRARRGTLESEKEADGTVYVWLDGGTPDGTPGGLPPTQAHLDSLEAQVEYLKQIIDTRDRELSEMRRLLAGALERIPELQAPPDTYSEPRESPEMASNLQPGVDSQGEGAGRETGESRPWWRRWFGG